MGQCMKVGCSFEGTHSVKIIIPDEDEAREPGESYLPHLELCEVHADAFPAVDFLGTNPAVLALVSHHVKEGARLDPTMAFAEAIPLGSPEHAAFMAVAEQKAN